MLKLFLLSILFTVTLLSGIKIYVSSELVWAISFGVACGWLFLSQREYRENINNEKFNIYKFEINRKSRALFPWLCLIFSIILASSLNDYKGLYAAVKYSALLAFFFIFILSMPTQKEICNALKALIVISIVCFLIVYFYFDDKWLVFTPSRYGWAWAPPGVLWYSGIYIIPYLSWLIVFNDKVKVSHWVWLILASIIVGLDGSRTGSVVIPIIWSAVFLLAIFKYGFNKRLILKVISLSVLLMIFVGGVNPSSYNPYQLISQHVRMLFLTNESVVNESVVNESGRNLEEDPIRLKMLKEGIAGSYKNAPWGAGFGSTTVYVPEIEGEMVIHNTYLQILSDLGVIGFFSYLFIFLIPCSYTIKYIIQSRRPWVEVEEYTLPLGVVSVYMFAGLFHPLSNEISEWAIVIIALSMLSKPMLNNIVNNKK